MDLKCFVNGKEYKDKMVQGIVVSEEYNETLDSATVILSQVPKIKDLRPYDDFYIYEGEFKGYGKNREIFLEVDVKKYYAFFNFNVNVQENNVKIEIESEKIQNYKFFNLDFVFIDTNTNEKLKCQYELVHFFDNDDYDFVLKSTDYDFLPNIFLKKGDGENQINGVFSLHQEVVNENYTYDFVFFDVENLIIITQKESGIEEVFTTFKTKIFDNSKKAPIIKDHFRIDNFYDLKNIKKYKIIANIKETNFFILKDLQNDSYASWVKKNEYVEKQNFDFVYINDDDFKLIPEKQNVPEIIFSKKNGAYYYATVEANSEIVDEHTIKTFEIESFYDFKVFNQLDDIIYDGFYRHFLVDQYTEEMLNIDENPDKILYKYKIELFSETKKLETIQIPNFSVTQPQHGGEKKSVWSYIVDVVDMYNPVYKFAFSKENQEWTYIKKYTVDKSLKEIFENIYCPDFTLNNPNLRDVLAQLMLVADRIPYVEDDVVKALDITQRTADFNRNVGEVTNIVGSRTSSNHCDNLKRTYSNALSQENTAHTVEYIGFRNSSSGMLTLENLKLETRFPIYKINKVYMCYYKKVKVISEKRWEEGATYSKNEKVTYKGEMYKSKIDDNVSNSFEISNWELITKEKIFLCKQDISKLILLNSERNLIKQDWTEFHGNENTVISVEEMSKYKFLTLGYDIGSNVINDFGVKYSYFTNPFWDSEATYVENILVNVDKINPYGIYDIDYFKDLLEEGELLDTFEIKDKTIPEYLKTILIHPFSNASLGLKSLIFQVDYNAFYNGTIYHSKDTDRDDIVINDNSSSSLTLLEQDGIHQKEKANRFGNKTITISARYKDVNDLQPLGSVYNYEEENDIIIYHRQYSIFDNIITCSYSGSRDYVLKNYFTTVYAKHRPYNLMSYGESVRRSENRKMYVMLSKDKAYIEKENNKYETKKFIDSSLVSNVFSFYKPDEISASVGVFKKKNKINYGYITFKDKDGKTYYYASDINSFTSGNSLCFNLSMYDNVSAGAFLDIEQLEPGMFFSSILGLDKNNNKITINLTDKQKDYIRGTKQKWYLTVDNEKEGHTKKLGFFVCHKDDENLKNHFFDISEKTKVMKKIQNELFSLPKIVDVSDIQNVIGGDYLLNKDNKELIDMTFQIEIIKEQKEKNLFFSNWVLKLSDLLSINNKFDNDKTLKDFPGIIKTHEIMSFSVKGSIFVTYPLDSGSGGYTSYYAPVIIICVNNDIPFEKGQKLNNFVFNGVNSDPVDWLASTTPDIQRYILKLNEIIDIDEAKENVVVSAKQETTVAKFLAKDKKYTNNIEMKFKKINSFGITQIPSGQTWYCNCELDVFGGNNSIIQWDIDFVDKQKIMVGLEERTIESIHARSPYEINPVSDILNKNYVSYGTFGGSGGDEVVYRKNLFVATSTEKIDNTFVYKQFLYNNDEIINQGIVMSNVYNPKNIFSIEKSSNGVEQLIITVPKEYIDNKVKSIQVWYLDNDDQRYVQNDVLYFVLGVNLEYDDNGEILNVDEFDPEGNGLIKYNISVLSTRDLRVFDENHMEIGKVKNIANSSDFETEQTYEKNEEQQ